MKTLVIVLQTVFLTLKLAGIINWSWWLVFSPLLIPLAVFMFILISVIVYNFGKGE